MIILRYNYQIERTKTNFRSKQNSCKCQFRQLTTITVTANKSQQTIFTKIPKKQVNVNRIKKLCYHKNGKRQAVTFGVVSKERPTTQEKTTINSTITLIQSLTSKWMHKRTTHTQHDAKIKCDINEIQNRKNVKNIKQGVAQRNSKRFCYGI